MASKLIASKLMASKLIMTVSSPPSSPTASPTASPAAWLAASSSAPPRSLQSRLRWIFVVTLIAVTTPQCFTPSSAHAETPAKDPFIAVPPTQALANTQLIATILTAERPAAVLRRGTITQVIRRGDCLADHLDAIEVAAILDGRVLLRRRGRLEYLPLLRRRPLTPRRIRHPARPARGKASHVTEGFAASVRQLGPRRYQVRRRALEALLAQPQAVVRTLRVLPISRGGRPDGFRLLYLTAQSPLRALGLRRGDVLQAINGRRVATVEALLSVYAKMRQASHVSLGLRRAHRTISLDYAIR